MTEPDAEFGTLHRVAIFQTDPFSPICACVLCINAINIGCGAISPIYESAYKAEVLANHAAMALDHGDGKITVRVFPTSR